MVRRFRKNRRTTRARPRRRNVGGIIETMISDIKIGESVAMTYRHLSNVPMHTLWRPVSLTVQATGSFTGIQIILCDPSGHYAASSPVTLLSSVTRRVTVGYPRSADWYQPLDVEKPAQIAILNAICTSKNASTGVIPVVATMRVRVRNEIVKVTCPVTFTSLSTPSISGVGSPFSSIGD